MKKLILGVSLLAFCTAAHAEQVQMSSKKPIQKDCIKPVETVKVKEFKSDSINFKITGETSANHYVFGMKQKNENGGKGRGNHLAVEDSLLNFDVSSSYANHEFGYLIGITGNAEKGENPIKENRIKVKGAWGTILVGDTKSPSDFMAVDTSYFVGGTGGVLGNYRGVINESTGTILKTDLLDVLSPKDQTKIIYVSPNFYGFQAGYAYIPDGSHKGEQKLASHSPHSHGIKTLADKRLSGQNFHEMVLKYKITPAEKFNIDFSGSTIFGKMRNLDANFSRKVYAKRDKHNLTASDSIDRNDLCSFATGLVVSYNGFSIGSEFVNNGKSAQLKILDGANMGKVWTIGAGYADQLNKISLTYFNSKRNLGKIEDIKFGNAKAENIALTFDRQILPGMTLYAEGLLLNHKNSSDKNVKHWSKHMNGFSDEVIHSNKGKVITTGTRLKF